MFGFDRESVYKWHEHYFRVFRDYLDREMFVGKDQNLMSTVCLETNMCLLIRDNFKIDNLFIFIINLKKYLIQRTYICQSLYVCSLI